MATPRIRRAARVITLDPDDRVLLLRYEDSGHAFWATPGGSLADGETFENAARREVHEELGLEDIELSGQLAERTSEHTVADEQVRQVERYYISRIHPDRLDAAQATDPDQITDSRWWRLEELSATTECVYPGNLAELVVAFLTTGTPSTPITLAP